MSKGQADRIILNLDDSDVSPEDLKSRLQLDPVRGLKEIKIVRQGVVSDFYPWSEER